MFKELLQKDFAKESKINLKCRNGSYTFELEFSNTLESSLEYEKIIQEALEYYDKLRWIAIVDNSFEAQQRELLKICSEVRLMRWQKQ